MLLFQHTAFVSFIYNTERGMKAELLSIICRGEKKNHRSASWRFLVFHKFLKKSLSRSLSPAVRKVINRAVFFLKRLWIEELKS